MNNLDDLDSLYKDAKRAWLKQNEKKEIATRAKSKGMDADKEDAPAHPQERYTNAANWTRVRGIALIHEETNTLLGNFGEWVHKTEAGCRKLVREEGPVQIAGTERVSGSWWLPAEQVMEPRQSWHTKQSATLHVHLEKCKLHAPDCALTVCLSYGSIARVELAADTTFAQADSSEQQLVFLPAGLDILKEMSQDSKIALRLSLGATV